MTRSDYLAARRLFRDNGRYALRWMPQETRLTMLVIERPKLGITADPLQERAWIKTAMGDPFLRAAIKQDGKRRSIWLNVPLHPLIP